jgi:hypothetical protein
MSTEDEHRGLGPQRIVPPQGPDPLVTVVTGYMIGSLLHGGLDLSLISIDASTNDNRSTFTVEGKHNRKRLAVTVREIHE